MSITNTSLTFEGVVPQIRVSPYRMEISVVAPDSTETLIVVRQPPIAQEQPAPVLPAAQASPILAPAQKPRKNPDAALPAVKAPRHGPVITRSFRFKTPSGEPAVAHPRNIWVSSQISYLRTRYHDIRKWCVTDNEAFKHFVAAFGSGTPLGIRSAAFGLTWPRHQMPAIKHLDLLASRRASNHNFAQERPEYTICHFCAYVNDERVSFGADVHNISIIRTSVIARMTPGQILTHTPNPGVPTISTGDWPYQWKNTAMTKSRQCVTRIFWDPSYQNLAPINAAYDYAAVSPVTRSEQPA